LIDNKYSRLYNSIINGSIDRNIDGYIEKHHIIPKSLGGINTPSNIAELTAREHYICHYLLTKCLEGDDRNKMIYAFNMMNVSTKHQDRYHNSRLYEANRKEFSKTHSANQTGKRHTKETKRKMSEGRKGSNNVKAKCIDIFNADGSIMFTCNGTFYEVCKLNDLPARVLQRSYIKGGTPIYSKKLSEKKKSWNIYVGWYAKIRNI